jgi:hypothetical protein
MVTSTGPADPLGAVATIDVEEVTVNAVAEVPANFTAEAPLKLAPTMVTTVPPAEGPVLGVTLVTVGLGASYSKWSAELVELEPTALVATTSTTPATSAGAVAVIWDDEFTVNAAAGTAEEPVPNETAVTFARLLPLMTTVVPPAVEPAAGLTPLTLGSGW